MLKVSKKLIILAVIAVIGIFGFGGYSYWNLNQENTQLESELSVLNESLNATKDDLQRAEDEKTALGETLREEQNKNEGFAAKIGEVTTLVGNLQKLSSTDPELLRKYSKVYFLSENYIPDQLSSVDSQYLYEKERPQLFHSGALPYLHDMMRAVGQNDLTIQIVSAYRSFYDQEIVKSGYEVLYGEGTANQFSADQGYSEHQLGTTVDFSTSGIDGILAGFEKSDAFDWLNENAYKFGFVLSYPEDNTYYAFEPWHWRFVGLALAKELHDTNKNFYDLNQREIDSYLITIFN